MQPSEPKSEQEPIKEQKLVNPGQEQQLVPAESGEEPEYILVDYKMYTLESEKITPAEYAAPGNAKEIQRRVVEILELEAPIERELLIRRTHKSFGLSRSNQVIEATEKAIKAVKPKNNKISGTTYCWLRDQEPNEYLLVRGGENSKNARNVEEICPQELRNAICYILQTQGSMDKATLLKGASNVLGYLRMTENISTAVDAGIRYAKKTGAVSINSNGTFSIGKR
ncbi:MAG: DUF3320 domain-containing protein [Firmicutes bacterium]|nr:DUF3320 domain-containing protein [Bacillota bacterium]